jgi:hypothetical protein
MSKEEIKEKIKELKRLMRLEMDAFACIPLQKEIDELEAKLK